MTTYRAAGVDLAAADRHVAAISETVTSTWGPDVVGAFGGFAAGLRLPDGYRRPVLMMTTDGVGTKAELARLAGRHDGLGFDLVAMCVDDLAAIGARPLALVDYLAVGRLDAERDRAIVHSVAEACRQAGCVLLGGETAQHPQVMEADRFDLAGAALGVVEDGQALTGELIRPGDVLLGVGSPGLRCNGFSLVRAEVLSRTSLNETFPGSERTVGDVLLDPSVIYAPAMADALSAGGVHGLAHVTGGGLPGNLRRVLPEGCRAVLDLSSWEPPAVFGFIASIGEVPEEEMLRTFNMGVGFVAVVEVESAPALVEALKAHGHSAWRLGELVPGHRGVEFHH